MRLQGSVPGAVVLKLPAIPEEGKAAVITIATGEGQTAGATHPGSAGGLGNKVIEEAIRRRSGLANNIKGETVA